MIEAWCSLKQFQDAKNKGSNKLTYRLVRG